MAILIIDRFQAIHVKEHHAERALRAPRTIELGFDYAQQPAVVRKAGQRIADGERADLIKQARLIQQSSEQHDDVARGFAEFRKEEGPVKKMTGECGSDVADDIQGSDHKKRVVVNGSRLLVLLDAKKERYSCGKK